MTVQQAYEKIQAALAEKKAVLDGLGLVTRARAFYTDKNLIEKSEFNAKCILVFGNLDIGVSTLEEDDWCNFSLCAEIKTGNVEDEALESALGEWCAEVDAFIEKIELAESKESFIINTSRAQEADAEAAAMEFAKEIKKVRSKMIIGFAIIIALMVGVMILGIIF